MPDVLRKDLLEAVTALHRLTSSPFDLFVGEATRALGLHAEIPRDEAAAEAVRPVLQLYGDVVDELPAFTDILGPIYSEMSSRGRRDLSCALQILVNLIGRGWTIGRLEVFHGDTLAMTGRRIAYAEAIPPAITALARMFALLRQATPLPTDPDDTDGDSEEAAA